jgi:hypothetical protein
MSSHSIRRTFIAGLFIALLCSAPSFGQTMYGISFVGPDGASTLNTIDPATGIATPVGPLGFERCGAMEADAAGTLYAACERSDGSDIPVLVTVDSASGAATEVGPTGMSGTVGDLSFRSDGVLFAFDASNDPDHSLFTVDTATGVATLVGNTGLAFAGGNGMTFDGADTLFHSQITGGTGPDLNTLDPSDGSPTFLGEITTTTGRFSAMEFDPSSGLVYGVINEGTGGAGPNSLATLDTAALTSTVIGTSVNGLDAIAVVSSGGGTGLQDIPTLDTTGLIGLILLLAAAGAIWIGRRR